MVVGEGPAGGEGGGGVEAVDEGLEVGFVLLATGFFLAAVGGGQRVIHFIERAIRVEAVALEHSFVAVLDHVEHAVERAIAVDADRESEVVDAAGAQGDLMRQRVAGAGLVGVVGQDVDILDFAIGGFRPGEAVVGVEIEVMAFLGESGGALAVEIDGDVVIKPTEMIQGAAGARRRAGRRRIFDELVHHRQRAGGLAGVERDRAEVAVGIQRIGKRRRGAGVAVDVGRLEAPAEHLAGGGAVGRQAGGEDTVAGDRIRRHAIVGEREERFRAELRPPGDARAGGVDGVQRAADPHGERLRRACAVAGGPRQAGGGLVEDRADRARTAIRRAGGGRREIPRR